MDLWKTFANIRGQYKRSEALVRYLLTAGADVSIQDVNSQTALTYFMMEGTVDFIPVMQLLVSKGFYFDKSNLLHESFIRGI